jgi:hypothetical protein
MLFEPQLFLVGRAVYCRQILQIGAVRSQYGSSHLLLLPMRSSLGARIDLFVWLLFCWKYVSFSSLPVSLRSSKTTLGKKQGGLRLAGPTWPHTVWVSLVFLPTPHQVEVKFYLHLTGHQFCSRGVQSAHNLCWTMWVPPEKMMYCSYLAVLLGRIWSAPGWCK